MELPLPDRGALWAFFLDVDGTLADIAPHPEAVAIAAYARDTLSRLADGCGGAVALVSGRAISDLDRLFAPLYLPAAGLHGFERRDAQGRITRADVDTARLETVRAGLAAFAAGHPGVLVEDKGLSLALHYRQAPVAEAGALALAQDMEAAAEGALVLQRGKMVVELRPAGHDKGAAVAAFMAEPPFAGRRPVFVGDDVTDEAGFATINVMDGISIRVGDGRPTCACYDGASVAGIHDWLAAAADRLAGGAETPGNGG